MPPRPPGRRLIPAQRIAVALIACTLAYADVHAQFLSQYFPTGIPGYGTAPGVTVQSRAHPDYDPLGTRLGTFVLRPQLEQGFGYDDNVFGGTSKRGSWLVGTRPSLLVNS